jgi:hypothetical protein
VKEVTTGTVKQDKTRAEITFADGKTRTIESPFEDSQGYGYDGGSWGRFPSFRDHVEQEVRLAQQKWGLPEATIKYVRVTRVVETVERTTTSVHHYRTRIVSGGMAAQ